ncbi:MAG: L-ribulose-5-phosphate 4-epimerase, partial [Treponema sp.]|nr:L-ribulose-5-phosphate 4-epimerase [Treponema sp.]
MEELKEAVYRANLELRDRGLAILTWGNASGIDRERGVVAIKPSGVAYDAMRPEDMVLVDLDGKVLEGTLRP